MRKPPAPRSSTSAVYASRLVGLLAMGLPAAASASEPVLLPDFAPPGPDDWAITAMVQQLVVDRLVQDGMIVLTSDVASRAVPAQSLQGCAPSPSCPQEVLPNLPARMATVVALSRVGSTMIGHVELYTTGQPQATSTADIPIVPGNEHMFAVEVSRGMQALLAQIGPSPDSVLLAAARLIAGQAPAPVPVPAPVVVPAPVPVPTGPPVPLVDLDDPNGGYVGTAPPVAPAPVAPRPGTPPGTTPSPVPRVTPKKGDGSTPHTGPLEPILEGTGVHERHLLGSEQAFRKSGLDPRDFMFQKTPHAGRLTVQVGAALGMGDVDRSAVALALVQEGTQINSFYEEGPDSARRVRGDLFVGYAPATMVDFGLTAGLQYSGRDIRFQRVDRSASGAVAPGTPRVQEAQAVQFYLQPRVRAYLAPLGPAKPYLVTGMELRIMDSYDVAPSEVTYLLPDKSVVIPGWVGGGGLMIDPGPIVGLYAEGSYTHHFGTYSRTSQGYTLADWQPVYTPVPDTMGITVAVGGGVQFRL